MNYNGLCFWADDVPDSSAPHYIVIATSKIDKDAFIVVPISSVKYKENGEPKYFDKACHLGVGDIVRQNGKSVITKPSFVRYQYAILKTSGELLEKQVKRKYNYMAKVSDSIMQKIQAGALVSLELPPRIRKHFIGL